MAESEHRVALVTGAGSGVGRASAIALVHAGYFVYLAGRNLDKLQETGNLTKTNENTTRPVVTDITEPTSVTALFQAIKDERGRLDVLFNNAGAVIPSTPLDDVSFSDWNTIVSTNLTGTFLCTQEAFRLMKSQDPMGGRIINNGSVSAHSPRPGSAPYTATKHAITGLTKSTSLDGRPFNIACGQIDIGNAETAMTTRMHQGVPQANGNTRVEPTMAAEHVGNAVVQMANLPLDANIQTMTIMATQMPFVGRG